MATRNHFREIFHTLECPTEKELSLFDRLRDELGDLVAAEFPAEKSWYKTGIPDVPVVSETRPNTVDPLSKYSNVVANMKSIRQRLLFVRPEDLAVAQQKKQKILGGNHG